MQKEKIEIGALLDSLNKFTGMEHTIIPMIQDKSDNLLGYFITRKSFGATSCYILYTDTIANSDTDDCYLTLVKDDKDVVIKLESSLDLYSLGVILIDYIEDENTGDVTHILKSETVEEMLNFYKDNCLKGDL